MRAYLSKACWAYSHTPIYAYIHKNIFMHTYTRWIHFLESHTHISVSVVCIYMYIRYSHMLVFYLYRYILMKVSISSPPIHMYVHTQMHRQVRTHTHLVSYHRSFHTYIHRNTKTHRHVSEHTHICFCSVLPGSHQAHQWKYGWFQATLTRVCDQTTAYQVCICTYIYTRT
jgi:hypothetical protein